MGCRTLDHATQCDGRAYQPHPQFCQPSVGGKPTLDVRRSDGERGRVNDDDVVLRPLRCELSHHLRNERRNAVGTGETVNVERWKRGSGKGAGIGAWLQTEAVGCRHGHRWGVGGSGGGGSKPHPDDVPTQASRLVRSIHSCSVARPAGLLTAPVPRGGTREREMPPCLCVCVCVCGKRAPSVCPAHAVRAAGMTGHTAGPRLALPEFAGGCWARCYTCPPNTHTHTHTRHIQAQPYLPPTALVGVQGKAALWRTAPPRPPAPRLTFRRVAVSVRGPGQSPVLPFACCVGSMLSDGRCGLCSLWCCFRISGARQLAYWGLCW